MRAHGTGSITRRRSGRYTARLPESHGRTSLGDFDTEVEARTALSMRLDEIARGADVGSLTLDAWGLRWLAARAASGDCRHVATERGRWTAYVSGSPIGRLPLRTVDAADVREWVGALTGKRRARLSGSTRVNALVLLRSALAGALEAGHLPANPAAGVKLSKGALRRTHEGWSWLRADEIAAVLRAAPSPKARSLWTVGAYTGLRTGELLGLRWEDIDFARTELHVRHTRDDAPKTAAALRAVSLLGPAQDALLMWREMSAGVHSPRGLVWTSPTGGCHVLGYDAGFVEVARAELGRRATIRDLRHTCASHLLQGTWAPVLIDRALRMEEVRDWLGHTSVTVTQRYAHLASDGTRSLVRTVPVVPVQLVQTVSHFRELNPGPTVYESAEHEPVRQGIGPVSAIGGGSCTSPEDLAAEVGQWIVRGKRPPLPLVGRLVEAVLGAAHSVVRRVG